jgi:hypothetical protein
VSTLFSTGFSRRGSTSHGTRAVASVGGFSVAVPDFVVALRDSSFWCSLTDSLGRAKLSSAGFGGCK